MHSSFSMCWYNSQCLAIMEKAYSECSWICLCTTRAVASLGYTVKSGEDGSSCFHFQSLDFLLEIQVMTLPPLLALILELNEVY